MKTFAKILMGIWLSGSVPGSFLMAGALSNTSVSLSSSNTSASVAVTLSFTTTSTIPNPGKIAITFPAGFTTSGAHGQAASMLTGLTGVWMAGAAGQVVTLTQIGGATTSPGAKSLKINGIVNPNISGLTGAYALQTVDASNLALDTGSAPGSVIIPPQPLLVQGPQSQTLRTGGTISLQVKATGGGLAYQWLKDGLALIGQTNATLTIGHAQAADAGNYTVIVSNAGGAVTSPGALVTVLAVTTDWLANFTLDGNGLDATSNCPPMDLLRTDFVANALYLNGQYEFDNPPGYRAVANIKGLSYDSFTAALEFKMAQPGGTASRPLTSILYSGRQSVSLADLAGE